MTSTTSVEKLCVIQPYGYSESKCGYCKGSRSNLPPSNDNSSSSPQQSLSSKSYSVLADSISPTMYEGLIVRGWRRSGVHLYKPQNFSSCCPTLTTRLLTKDFRPTKSQRKILKKMENILTLSSQQIAAKQMPTIDAAKANKKLKRHHIEKNIKLTKSITTKISSFHSSIEEQVLASGLLKKVEQATTNAIEKYLSSLSIQKIKWKEVKERNACDWKTNYRLLSPSKKERKQARIRAVSIVCAQISGQLSSSSITQLSREGLVEQVAEAIKEEILLLQNSSITPDEKDGKQIDTAVFNNSMATIASIEAHPPSGQIRCTFQVQHQEQQQQIRSERSNCDPNDNSCISDNDIEMNESSHENFKNHNIKNISKLGKWYEKTTGKELQVEPSQHQITIETMPAHQSALDPDVHRLYAHYQHVVHDDPDPFTDNQIDNSNNINNEEDDEDDEIEEPPIYIDDPSKMDWGNAPSYFTEKIPSVLTTYIQSIKEGNCRRAVLANYYSFYQFLVEAPFPLPVYNRRCSKKILNSSTRKQSMFSSKNTDDCLSSSSSFPSSSSSSQQCGGLYHQHYRLGGDLLIAVGVIDILPNGLSSVYLFYHPGFSYDLVALGKYAILKEIEFARDALKVPYYYLGYYIESCQKMSYKAEYKPTQMLCPKYYDWVDATEAIAKLRMTKRHVCPLIEVNQNSKENEDNDSNSTNTMKKKKNNIDTDTDITTVLNSLQMDIGAGINVTIDMLQSSGVEVVKPILEEFISEFSPELSKKCLIKLS